MDTFIFPIQIFTKQCRENLIQRRFHRYFKATRRDFSCKHISVVSKTMMKWSQKLKTVATVLAEEAQQQEEEERVPEAKPVAIDSS